MRLRTSVFGRCAYAWFVQMQHERHWARSLLVPCNWLTSTLSRLWDSLISKHVIQASTASSHRVGKCIIEPSKQSRIRKSSFWSHRRSTVQWETALSSKERSRRVNCPMIAPLLDVVARIVFLASSSVIGKGLCYLFWCSFCALFLFLSFSLLLSLISLSLI